MSSVLHVALLVSLRVYAIFRPTSYREMHVKLRYISIIVIWSTSIFLHAVILTTSAFKNETISYHENLIIFFCFNALPVGYILFMYGLLIWRLRIKRSTAIEDTVKTSSVTPAAEATENKIITLVKRIIIVLILCYGPFLIWRVYFYTIDFLDTQSNRTLLDEEVINFSTIQLNLCYHVT